MRDCVCTHDVIKQVPSNKAGGKRQQGGEGGREGGGEGGSGYLDSACRCNDNTRLTNIQVAEEEGAGQCFWEMSRLMGDLS